MKTIEDLRVLRMYSPKTKIYAPVNTLNKRKGAAILLLTKDTNESEMVMNLPYIYNPNLFTAYYISKNVNAYIKSDNKIEVETNDIEDDTSVSDEDVNKMVSEASILSKIIPIKKVPKIVYDQSSCSVYDTIEYKKDINQNIIKNHMEKLQIRSINSNIITIYSHRDPNDFIGKSISIDPLGYSLPNEIHLLCKSSFEANSEEEYNKYIDSELYACLIQNMNPNLNIFLVYLYAFYLTNTININDSKYINFFTLLGRCIEEDGIDILLSLIYTNDFSYLEKKADYKEATIIKIIKKEMAAYEKILREVSIDEAIKCHGYFYDNRWNSLAAINNKLYRDRVECLIFNKKEETIYLYFKEDGAYDIPGGSVDKDTSNETQIKNECKEEAKININKVKDTELIYIKDYDKIPDWMEKLPIKWTGTINRVYTAEFDSFYTGLVEDIDKDTDMYKLGKFYKIQDVYHLLTPVHKVAAMHFMKDHNIKIRLPLSTSSKDLDKLKEASNINPIINYNKMINDGYIVNDDYFAYHSENGDIISFMNDYENIDEAVKINQKANDIFLKRYLYKERIRTTKELTTMYADIKTRNPWIKRTYPYLSRYNSFNIYIDFSYYHSLFLKNTILKNDKGVGVYWDIINRLLDTEEINKNYPKQTVMIPVNANSWNISNSEDLFNYRVSINPISSILRVLRSNPAELKKWANKKILFVSNKGFFTIDFGTFSLANMPKFKKFIRMLMNFEPITYEDDEEDINEDTPAVKINKTIDNIEKSTGVQLSNDNDVKENIDMVNKEMDIVTGSSLRSMTITKAKVNIPLTQDNKNFVYILSPTQDSTIKTINDDKSQFLNRRDIKNITII